MNVIKLTDLDVSGKRVFIRADLNVPQDEAGNITEDTRIRASLPSIRYCLEKGAAVMVTSHLGRPTEGELNPEDSLTPVAVRLGQMLHKPVRLIADWVDGGFEVKPGEVVLRITSYNVCYTKLLRNHGFSAGWIPDHEREYSSQVQPLDRRHPRPCVITSYSIHYTKLYEHARPPGR